MANSQAIFREIRFIIEDELTQCYVFFSVRGDSPIGIEGWHHKTFPASMTAVDILNGFGGDDDPIFWAQQAPPNN